MDAQILAIIDALKTAGFASSFRESKDGRQYLSVKFGDQHIRPDAFDKIHAEIIRTGTITQYGTTGAVVRLDV